MMNERPKRKRNNTKFVDYLEEVPDEYILQPPSRNNSKEKKIQKEHKMMTDKKQKIKKAAEYLISFVNYTNKQKDQHDKQNQEQESSSFSSFGDMQESYRLERQPEIFEQEENHSIENLSERENSQYTFKPVFYEEPLEKPSPERFNVQKSFHGYSPKKEEEQGLQKMQEQVVIQKKEEVVREASDNLKLRLEMFDLAKKVLENKGNETIQFPFKSLAGPQMAYFIYYMKNKCKQVYPLRIFQAQHIKYFRMNRQQELEQQEKAEKRQNREVEMENEEKKENEMQMEMEVKVEIENEENAEKQSEQMDKEPNQNQEDQKGEKQVQE